MSCESRRGGIPRGTNALRPFGTSGLLEGISSAILGGFIVTWGLFQGKSGTDCGMVFKVGRQLQLRSYPRARVNIGRL